MSYRLTTRNTQPDQFPAACAHVAPAIPETHADPATDALIGLVEQLQLRSQIEVTHSPTAIVKDEAKDF